MHQFITSTTIGLLREGEGLKPGKYGELPREISSEDIALFIASSNPGAGSPRERSAPNLPLLNRPFS